MSKYCVIGKGFLGGAIARSLGDVTSYPTPETKVLFHFASHVHPVFETNPHFEMQHVFSSFPTLLDYCAHHGILFVFPSSALVYEADTQFARFKLAQEQLVSCYPIRSLGLRIYPAYGPGENRTVISQWCRQMSEGRHPIVYGNGEQTRDFIFIDDVVDQILSLVDEPSWGARIVDIGTGISTPFNTIVDMINAELGTRLPAVHVHLPSSYSEGIFCKNPLPAKVSVQQGIRKILATIHEPVAA